MSLDNVIAIAASAEAAAARVDIAHAGAIKTTLIVFGLATSIPMIIAGSALLMALLDRFPILVWAGAGLLGWVAGDIMIKDAALLNWFAPSLIQMLHYWAAAAGTAFVIAIGWLLRSAHHRRVREARQVVESKRMELPSRQPAERTPVAGDQP
jgi:predicted tellurium resistance membrane protein TerC